MKLNNTEGFDKIVEPEPIPYDIYMAEMGELHRLVGGVVHIVDNARDMILGYIDGCKKRHGATEPTRTRARRQEISYALRRAAGHTERTDLSNDEVLAKVKAEIMPLYPKKETK